MVVSMNALRLSLENQTYMSYSKSLEEANDSVNHYDQLVAQGASKEDIHKAEVYMNSDLDKVKSLGKKLSEVSKESMSVISKANSKHTSYSEEPVRVKPEDVGIISKAEVSVPEAVYVTATPVPITVEAHRLDNGGYFSWLLRVAR